MGGAYLERYQVQDGPRYRVVFRLGGRGARKYHAGAFRTRAEALERRKLILLDLAGGRDPRDTLEALRARGRSGPTVGAWAESFMRARIDVTPSTYRTYVKRRSLLGAVEDLEPDRVKVSDVQDLIAGLLAGGLKVSYVRNVVGFLGMVLDEAGVEPNPARSRKVRWPKVEREIPIVPSGEELDAIRSYLSKNNRLLLDLLEATGLRLGEALALQWQDVDTMSCRLRVRRGKTPSARRWVSVDPEVLGELLPSTAPDDRMAERKVLGDRHESTLGKQMAWAARAAGVAHYHPHDLRHRYASIMARLGVPRTDLARQLGHAKVSELDTYEHVVVDITADELEVWIARRQQLLTVAPLYTPLLEHHDEQRGEQASADGEEHEGDEPR